MLLCFIGVFFIFKQPGFLGLGKFDEIGEYIQ